MSFESKKVPNNQHKLNASKSDYYDIKPISDILSFFVNVRYLKTIKGIVSISWAGGSLYL